MLRRSVEEWESAARDRLPEAVADFVAAGAGTESSLAGNREAWRSLPLVPRVLRGASEPSADVRVGGRTLAAPILLAPAGRQRALHPEGEVAVARAARAFGTVSILATSATTDLHDLARDVPGAALWQQLYVSTDRDWTSMLLAEAAAAGFDQIVLTVDRPREAFRPRSARHGGMGPLPAGVAVTNHRGGKRSSEPGVWDAALTWADAARLIEESPLPVAIKGILHPDDARRAVDAGAAGVIVSNHGGRQLDGVLPSARALPGVVAAVAGQVPVDVDGGIRGGGDVFRALALGARATLIGRPYLWSLAAEGQRGVEQLLAAFAEELVEVMSLCGAARLEDIGPGHLAG